jgi:hypothetical protein
MKDEMIALQGIVVRLHPDFLLSSSFFALV